MMTGSEHYRAVQDHLDDAHQAPEGGASQRYHLKAAQIHAIAALVAATAAAGYERMGDTSRLEWQEIAE